MTPGATTWEAGLAGAARANPAYRLWSLGELQPRHRDSLSALGVDTESVAGLLVGSTMHFPDKVVDAGAAGLFAALATPGRPPAEVLPRLAELVLDGILEVETTDGFLSGAMAWDRLGPVDGWPVGDGRLACLSREAIDYAERLRLRDGDGITSRLYCYHRIPLSRRWSRAYPDRRAVRGLLPERTLARDWIETSAGEGAPWLSWSLRDRRLRDGSAAFPYKLYISPRIEALPELTGAVIDALTVSSAPRFKIGASATELLRPDKIVVYLSDREEAAAVAEAVLDAIAGAPLHGVPFSAELGCDGLVSWGGDPPRDAAPIGRRSESWRLSVCRRLAEALVAGQRLPLTRTRPGDFALARLAAAGVDMPSFAPAALEPPRVRASGGLAA